MMEIKFYVTYTIMCHKGCWPYTLVLSTENMESKNVNKNINKSIIFSDPHF